MKKSLIILFLISILYAGIFIPLRHYLITSPNIMALLLVGYMWIPGVIALLWMRMEKMHIPIFTRPNRWFFLSALIAMGVCLISLFASIPFGDFTEHPVFADQKGWQSTFSVLFILIFAYVAGLTVNMIVALGEELYFRGYLWEKLKKQGPLKALGMIGAIWGLWYIPVIIAIGYYYPHHRYLGCLMVILLAFSLNPLLTYFRLKGKSIMVSAAFHGTFKAITPFIFTFFAMPNRLIIGPTGIIGIFVLVLVSLAFKLYLPVTWKKI